MGLRKRLSSIVKSARPRHQAEGKSILAQVKRKATRSRSKDDAKSPDVEESTLEKPQEETKFEKPSEEATVATATPPPTPPPTPTPTKESDPILATDASPPKVEEPQEQAKPEKPSEEAAAEAATPTKELDPILATDFSQPKVAKPQEEASAAETTPKKESDPILASNVSQPKVAKPQEEANSSKLSEEATAAATAPTKEADPVMATDVSQPNDCAPPPPVVAEHETKHDDDDDDDDDKDRHERNEDVTDEGTWDLALNPYPSGESHELQTDVKTTVLNEMVRETGIEVLIRCHSPSIAEAPREDAGVDGAEGAVAAVVTPSPLPRNATPASLPSETSSDKYESMYENASVDEASSLVRENEDWDPNAPIAGLFEQDSLDGRSDEDISTNKNPDDDESTAASTLSSCSFSMQTKSTVDGSTSKPLKCSSDTEEALDAATCCLDESKCPLIFSIFERIMPAIDEEEDDDADDLTLESSISGDVSNGSPRAARSAFDRQSTPLVANRRR